RVPRSTIRLRSTRTAAPRHATSALLSSVVSPRPRRSTLFPYTTLFRSPLLQRVYVLFLTLVNRTVLIQLEERKYYYNQTLERKTDRKSTRLNSSHVSISYAVFCLKRKK